jgi:GH15 family glucan-1,4-alpha-glucosidase
LTNYLNDKSFAEGKYFYKMISVDNNGRPVDYDTTIDTSSIYGVVHFSVLPRTERAVLDSFRTVNEKLYCRASCGGIPRYEGDRYYRLDGKTANPWFITTLWLAEQAIATAKNNEDLEPARECLRWVARYALPSGVLSEQLNPFTGEQLSAAPLIWSHSEFVLAVICYLEKLEELGICDVCNPMKVTDNPY